MKKLISLFEKQHRTKVFCIGYNKTGTTSVESLLRDLGYRMPVQVEQEALVVEALFDGDYRPLKALCDKYEAFQDLPFSQGVIYAVLDNMYPGSKFILTVRDSNTWFDSLVRFHLGGVLKKAGIKKIEEFNEETFKDKNIYIRKNYLYRFARRNATIVKGDNINYDWSLIYDRDYRIAAYESRNQEIVKYFQGRENQLLVVDVGNEKDSSKIVKFFGLPKDRIGKMPHLNKSAS